MKTDYRWNEPRVDGFRWTLFAALGLLNSCGAATDEPASSELTSEDNVTPNGSITPTGSAPVPMTQTVGKSVSCNAGAITNQGVVQCLSDASRRTEAQDCEDMRTPAPLPSATAGGDFVTCSQDSDCEGELSYCRNNFVGGPVATSCVTGCLNDSDCAPNQLCLCGSPMGACIPATCNSDSDCEEGAACLSYGAPCSLGAILGFACTTEADSCHSSSDCAVSGVGAVACGFSGERFECQTATACAVPGRPFLVAGEARLPQVTERSDFNAKNLAPNLSSLSGASREAIARHWLAAARMEHASIAAFARFQLQLLAVGAPAHLIKATNKAMADELSHARLCFALASAYLGKDVGPGPLDLHGAMPAEEHALSGGSSLISLNLANLVRIVTREGCIGETLAALEAEAALAHATDPAVRSVLTVIARDEQEHALLAWRFIAWLVNSDASLLRVVQDELGRYRREARARSAEANTGEVEHQAALAAHGVAADAARVHDVAWFQLIQPAAAALHAGRGQQGRAVANAGRHLVT